MMEHSIPSTVEGCLQRLARGDLSAREPILEACDERLRSLAHRLLGGFPAVRRWTDTDDVSQNAALRLYRALGATVPGSVRELMGLMALQIQRELLDLARQHAAPGSYAANHDTNARLGTDGLMFLVDEATAPVSHPGDPLAQRWETFHAAVESLPEDEREVFRLVWYLGLGQEDAAAALGCSSRTVRRRWKDARESIRRLVEAAG